MADTKLIRANIRRMIEGGASDDEIQEYMTMEGVTPEGLRAANASQSTSSAWDAPTRFMRRLNDNLLLGLNDEFQAGLRSLTGRDSYRKNLDAERNQLAKARSNSTIFDVVPDTLGLTANALVTLPLGVARHGAEIAARALGPTAQTAAKTVANALAPPTKRQVLGEATRVGGGFGATAAYGASEGSAGEQISDIAKGTAGGAALGRALPSAVYGTSERIVAPLTNALRTAKSAQARTPQQNARTFEEANVPVFGPALVDDGTVAVTGRSLTSSAVGRPLRDAVRRTSEGIESRLADSVDGSTAEMSEIGGGAQRFLRRQLTERSIPSEDIAAKADNHSIRSLRQLEEMSGVDAGGSPIPPRVQPVPPREVRPVTPEMPKRFDETPPVQPEYPAPRQPEIDPGDLASVPPRQDLLRRQVEIANDLKTTTKIADDLLLAKVAQEKSAMVRFQNLGFSRDDVLRRYSQTALPREPLPIGQNTPEGRGPEAFLASFNVPSERLGDLRRAVTEFLKLNDARIQLRGLKDRKRHLEELQSSIADNIEQARRADFAERSSQKFQEARRHADQMSQRDRAEAEAAARQKTQENRNEAVARAFAREHAAADKRTSQLRDFARREAEVETARLQREADVEFNRRLEQGDFSRTYGSTSETYPTEFDAGYALANRRFNPKSGQSSTVNLLREDSHTSRTLNDILAGARRSRVLQGINNVNDPAFKDYLARRIGREAVDALYGSKSGGGISLFGLRELRTTVRQASGAEPGFRKPADALVKRLEAAITDDYRAKLQTAMSEVPARLQQVMDQRYASFTKEIKAPLKRIFGEDVTPEQALSRLASAAKKGSGDIGTLRAFFRVYSDKGDTRKATTAVLTPLMKDGMSSFAKGFKDLSPEARKIIYRGRTKQLGEQHARLVKLWDKMEKFRSAADRSTSGLDLSQPTNWAIAAALFSNVPAGVATALGTHSLAQLMASPKFVAWMLKTPAAVRRGKPRVGALRHTNRLNAIMAAELGLSESTGNELAEMVVSRAYATGRIQAFPLKDGARHGPQPTEINPRHGAMINSVAPDITEKYPRAAAALERPNTLIQALGADAAVFMHKFMEVAKELYLSDGMWTEGPGEMHKLYRQLEEALGGAVDPERKSDEEPVSIPENTENRGRVLREFGIGPEDMAPIH